MVTPPKNNNNEKKKVVVCTMKDVKMRLWVSEGIFQSVK
jgi:hypothetical protein